MPLNKPSTACTYWIRELGLYTSDCERIQHMHGWLIDAVINATQTLLKRQYPDVGGLQNTHLGRILFLKSNEEHLCKCYMYMETIG